MATLTIRNLSEDLVERVKEEADKHQRSMEQEVRDLLQDRYGDRQEVFRRIRARWAKYPAPSARQVDAWIDAGRS